MTFSSPVAPRTRNGGRYSPAGTTQPKRAHPPIRCACSYLQDTTPRVNASVAVCESVVQVAVPALRIIGAVVLTSEPPTWRNRHSSPKRHAPRWWNEHILVEVVDRAAILVSGSGGKVHAKSETSPCDDFRQRPSPTARARLPKAAQAARAARLSISPAPCVLPALSYPSATSFLPPGAARMLTPSLYGPH